jgi:hypothetical protein
MPSNGRPGATDPTRGYANTDGPGGSTVDYGPHKGGFSFAGLQSPRWDDRDPSRDMTPAMLAAEQAARQPMIDRRNELLAGNDAYQQAKAAGDLKGQIAAMTAMRGQMQQDRFVAQGGTPETWQNRYDENNQWPVPRSPSGNYQYGPGRPGPTPPNVAQSAPSGVRRGATPQANAPMSAGAPPSQNPMMQGYLGGGAGVPQGPGGFGSAGYQPGQSKSGMGQSPMSGPAMSTGNPMGGGNYMDMNPNVAAGRAALGLGEYGRSPMGGGGADLNRWLAMRGGGNPGASMGGGEMGYMYGQPMMAAQGRTAPWQGLAPGSRQPIGPYQPPQLDPSMRGGGSGWGGMQAGYAPFDAGNYSMPYDMMGMGQWY